MLLWPRIHRALGFRNTENLYCSTGWEVPHMNHQTRNLVDLCIATSGVMDQRLRTGERDRRVAGHSHHLVPEIGSLQVRRDD